MERLLEGFAFLAARVQLKLDAEFPQFTQAILETVYPHYLSPTPSMAVVEFAFDMAKSGISTGFEIKRGTILRSVIGTDERTACEYRTGHPVMLWPVQITQADYIARDLRRLKPPPSASGARAAIRIRLETPADMTFSIFGIPLKLLTRLRCGKMNLDSSGTISWNPRFLLSNGRRRPKGCSCNKAAGMPVTVPRRLPSIFACCRKQITKI